MPIVCVHNIRHDGVKFPAGTILKQGQLDKEVIESLIESGALERVVSASKSSSDKD